MSENLPAKRHAEFQVALKAKQSTIQALLPTNAIDSRRMCISAMSCVMRNPKLLECNKDSFVFSVLSAAELGLDLSVIQHAALVPFKGKVTLQLMYKGVLELARRSGQIAMLDADVVRPGDVFEYEKGLDPKLKHIPALDNEDKPASHVYAVAVLKDGSRQFAIMTRQQVDAIRKRAPGYQFEGNDSPWRVHWDEMAKKTVLKRLCKLLPLSATVQRAVEIDSRSEAGKATAPLIEMTPEEFASVEDAESQFQPSLNDKLNAAQATLAETPAAQAKPPKRKGAERIHCAALDCTKTLGPDDATVNNNDGKPCCSQRCADECNRAMEG